MDTETSPCFWLPEMNSHFLLYVLEVMWSSHVWNQLIPHNNMLQARRPTVDPILMSITLQNNHTQSVNLREMNTEQEILQDKYFPEWYLQVLTVKMTCIRLLSIMRTSQIWWTPFSSALIVCPTLYCTRGRWGPTLRYSFRKFLWVSFSISSKGFFTVTGN